VAVVTGAGSGIGRAVAVALQGHGYDVVLAGRRQSALEETAALAKPEGGRFVGTVSDVADAASVEALFAGVARTFGRVDVLFNNAGVFSPAAEIDEVPIEEWNRAVGVNLTGAFLCARQAFGMMKRQSPRGGRIINNGSISAQVPRPGRSHTRRRSTRSLA
jgi:NAD(P)-dependent dehydrogenase (short-subunit alcohol dehydrogenase family)